MKLSSNSELGGGHLHERSNVEKGTTQIQSIARAVAVLDVLSVHPEGITAREISRETELHISTCHHILRTLVEHGVVRVESNHSYSLGPKIGDWYRKYTVGASLAQRIRHILEDLSFITLETSYMAVWHNDSVVIVDKVETIKEGIRQLVRGQGGPAHCRASGKALLAYLAPEALDEYLRRHPLTPRTKNTITDEEVLRRELQPIRERGYATDVEEFEEGWCCVAAPVRNREGAVVAVMAVSFHKTRIHEMEALAALTVRKAEEASLEIGDLL
jgi:IclR family acetate operon transcriptional repressor